MLNGRPKYIFVKRIFVVNLVHSIDLHLENYTFVHAKAHTHNTLQMKPKRDITKYEFAY